ncbi:MAG: hypothetical protein GY822_18645, partial [Deltaproteobacteria bacterium]|nr:hypothetical protein [Deltaproteobacteria bacterium]
MVVFALSDLAPAFLEADGALLYHQLLQQHGGTVGLMLINATEYSDVERVYLLQNFGRLIVGLGAALGNAAIYNTTLEDLVPTEMQASVERELEMQLVLDNMNDALVVVATNEEGIVGQKEESEGRVRRKSQKEES